MGKYRFANPGGLVKLAYQPQQVAFLRALAERHCPSCAHEWSIHFGKLETTFCPHCATKGRRNYDKMLLLAGRQGGKALALDTPIATTAGWKTMGELQVGDYVFDDAGRPTRVSYTSPVYVGTTCYRLEFSDGSYIVADHEHEWVTFDKLARKRWDRSPRTITTGQIAASLMHNGESNHAVALSGALQYPHVDLPVAPYTLGAWLGDGSSASAEITCSDQDNDILRFIEADGFEIRPRRVKDRTPVYLIGVPGHYRSQTCSLTTQLRRLDLIGNKHVPDVYLRASIADRLALLQGLMDTDGYCAADGQVEFCSTNPALASAVYDLAISFGTQPRLKADTAQLNGREIGPRYRVSWTDTLPAFRLGRKLARLPKVPKMSQYFRYIRKADVVPTVPVRCIQVDAASSMFLAGTTCIPTHNTRIGTLGGVLEASMPDSYGWVTAPTYRDLTDFVEPAFFAQLPQDWLDEGDWNISDRLLTLPENRRVAFRSLEDPQSVRGPTLDWWLMDEACKVSGIAHEVGDAMLAIKQGVEILTTTPRGEDWVYEKVWCLAEQGVPGYWAARWISTDNPTMSKAYVDGKRATMSPEMFKQEYEADFVTFQGAIYGSTMIDPCVIDDKTPDGFAQLQALIPEWPAISSARTAVVGLDPGSDHPFAAVLLVITEKAVIVCGEYKKRELPAMLHAQNLRAMVGGLSPRWGIDRSQAQMQIELGQHGIFTAAAENAVVAGIERVKSWMISGRLKFVKSRCRELLSELKSYRWKEAEKKDGSLGVQEPYKRKDDLCDALRYGLMIWPHLPEALQVDPGVRDLSKVPEKERRDIERMLKHEKVEKSKVAEGVGEFFGEGGDDTPVVDDFYAYA